MCNRDLLPEDFTESEAYQSIIYYLEHLGEREAEFDDMKAQFIEAISGITEDSEVINARVAGMAKYVWDLNVAMEQDRMFLQANCKT